MRRTVRSISNLWKLVWSGVPRENDKLEGGVTS